MRTRTLMSRSLSDASQPLRACGENPHTRLLASPHGRGWRDRWHGSSILMRDIPFLPSFQMGRATPRGESPARPDIKQAPGQEPGGFPVVPFRGMAAMDEAAIEPIARAMVEISAAVRPGDTALVFYDAGGAPLARRIARLATEVGARVLYIQRDQALEAQVAAACSSGDALRSSALNDVAV